MSVVLDASITVAWVHADETTNKVLEVFDDLVAHEAWVPGLWHLEVANVFQRKVRRGACSPHVRDRMLKNLSSLSILTDTETAIHAWAATLRLSQQHGLTVYDAAYLELALRRSLPMATLDADLRHAATLEGVPLRGL